MTATASMIVAYLYYVIIFLMKNSCAGMTKKSNAAAHGPGQAEPWPSVPTAALRLQQYRHHQWLPMMTTIASSIIPATRRC